MTDSEDRWEAVQRLVTGVAERSPFYRRLWAHVGNPTTPVSPADFAARFPFTSKADLVADQAAHPPYGSILTCPLDAYVRCHQTSGTTGSPLRWLDTAADWKAMTDDWATVLRAAGMTPQDRVFVAFSFGPFLGFWLAFEAAQQLGCLTLPGGGMSSAVRSRVILENQCTVLFGTPTYLLHLATVAQAEGLNLSKSGVRLLVVAGEPGGSLVENRRRLSEAWNGARVFDHHGMTEVGPVTYEHPRQPGTLIVLKSGFWAEVIEPTTQRLVPEGGPGELVLTTLHRPGSPLIRYRTGDLVRARTISSEGTLESGPTVLALEGGIPGRVDDMVVLRGVNVYPTAVDELIRSFPEIGEYRVTHDLRGALPELRLEVESSSTAAEGLALKLKHQLGLRIPVQTVSPGTLPHFELKARRWQRLTNDA